MMELIKRKDALEAIKNSELGQEYDEVEKVSVVDAVVVVRCKDCTHYEELRTGEGACHLNGKISWYIREDWFCADGERRV